MQEELDRLEQEELDDNLTRVEPPAQSEVRGATGPSTGTGLPHLPSVPGHEPRGKASQTGEGFSLGPRTCIVKKSG